MRSSSCNRGLVAGHWTPAGSSTRVCLQHPALLNVAVTFFLWQVNGISLTYSYGSKPLEILRRPISASCCQILSSLINDIQQMRGAVLWLAAVRSFWIYRVRPQNQWAFSRITSGYEPVPGNLLWKKTISELRIRSNAEMRGKSYINSPTTAALSLGSLVM